MRVAVHAFDGITMFHLAAPSLVFGEVARQQLADGWTIDFWSENGPRVRTAEGLSIENVSTPSIVKTADLLVLPSWHADLRPASDRLVGLLRRAHAVGTRMAGLCLGAFPLADSGLLDGRSAVTHWAAAAALASRRASVDVKSDALYIDHGDVLTSAGTASAIDACLHILRSEIGAAAASTVARNLVVAPHRDGGQAQYVDRPLPEPNSTVRLGETMDWALAGLDKPLTVDDLASHAGMSRRNFTRRFAEATGTTPARWLLARRLDGSRGLLERTDWPIERVARSCGFGSAVTFRQNFVAKYGTTPTSYRQRFTIPAE
ncbi:GlxA family transcriptional regulator [Streptomyces sp. B21-101]|uniref:GlxA family transcriptional regulator n=1 Tax=Streptomyces sp. B21-101 TaxID=3039415 RepID=UPI002FF398DC